MAECIEPGDVQASCWGINQHSTLEKETLKEQPAESTRKAWTWLRARS